MSDDDRDHSPERKKAEAMFGRTQSARTIVETEDEARRRESREKISRLKSLRTGNSASADGGKRAKE